MDEATRSWARFVLTTLIAVCLAPAARAVVIDFESGVSPGDYVTNQFSDATFSSVTAIEISHVLVIGPPVLFANFVQTTPLMGLDPPGTAPLFVDFTVPVNNLTFSLVASEHSTGTIVNVEVFHDGGTTEVPLASNGVTSFHKRTISDVAGFTNVTRIELYTVNYDNGVNWDDFSFDPNPPCNGNGYFLCDGLYPGDPLPNTDQCGIHAAPRCGGTAPDSCTLVCSSPEVPALSRGGLALLAVLLAAATLPAIRR